jgi:type 2 lantibiotic biosynthesis protein LanM
MLDHDARARAIIRSWMKVLQVHDAGQFRRRLEWDGVSPADAIAYLRSVSGGQSSDAFRRMQGWLRGSAKITESESATYGPSVSFAELWSRIARDGMAELAGTLPRGVAAHYQTERQAWGDYQDVHRDLSDELITRLSVVGESAIWAEFQRRRTPGNIVMAHLETTGPEGSPARRAVYCGFLDDLRSDGLQALTSKYPVLRGHLSTTLEHWLRSSREILVRAHDDRLILAEVFGVPANARLAGVRQGLSDPHRGGRTVAILSFRSASSQPRRVVYKPKDLRIDQAFQRLLSVVPLPTPADEPLRRVAVIARAGYGYMEWVPHQICSTDQELRHFYRNAGRLTAILHMLGCSDCHHENLIAHHTQLLLIDAETLFEGTPREHGQEAGTSTARTSLYEQISNSVIRLGLLPQWHFIGRQRIPRDVSALGIQPPERPHYQAAGWIGLNTDGMIPGSIERPARLPASLPVGVGSPNRLGDFVEDFCAGFESQLAAIAANKHRWLDSAGPLAAFRTYRRRFVPRPTWLYLWLRAQQGESAWLVSDVVQRLLLENLARSYLLSLVRPGNWPLFASEVAQMENLDVPFFEQLVDGADLITPDGSAIRDYFRVSGYENALRRLRSLDTDAINFQLRLIRGVVTAKNMDARASSARC